MGQPYHPGTRFTAHKLDLSIHYQLHLSDERYCSVVESASSACRPLLFCSDAWSVYSRTSGNPYAPIANTQARDKKSASRVTRSGHFLLKAGIDWKKHRSSYRRRLHDGLDHRCLLKRRLPFFLRICAGVSLATLSVPASQGVGRDLAASAECASLAGAQAPATSPYGHR